MKILIVSYQFPPMGGVGVQRALSFARYLPECGFEEVHVLRAWNGVSAVSDPGLVRHIPSGVKVHDAFTPELPFRFRQQLWKLFSGGARPQRTNTVDGNGTLNWRRVPVEIARRVFCPEPEVVWVPFALRRARKIVKQYGIDVVLVTAPPFSAFLVGTALKEQFPHIKLVTDFRDDWLRFYLGTFDYQNSDYTRRRAVAIERRTIELSDLAVVVTHTMLDDIRDRYPDQDAHKFALLPNGYEPTSFGAFRPPTRSGDKIVVSHVGTVYSASSARYFLDALDDMPEEVRSAIETRFIGRVADDEQGFLESRKTTVRSLGFRPQAEALALMQESDYLLLTMTDAASLTGKIFDYMAVGRPILAIAPQDGEVARIVQQTRTGRCVAPGDRSGIRDLLTEAYRQLRDGGNDFQPDWEAIRRYERPRLAAELAQLIQRIQ